MLGVDISGLNVLIEKVDYVSGDTKNDLKKMSSSMSELSGCYVGTSVDSIYSVISKQSGNLNKISSLLNSYFDVLTKLRETYISQEHVFSSELDDNIKRLQ